MLGQCAVGGQCAECYGPLAGCLYGCRNRIPRPDGHHETDRPITCAWPGCGLQFSAGDHEHICHVCKRTYVTSRDRPSVTCNHSGVETDRWWQVFCALLASGKRDFASVIADAAIAEAKKRGRL